MSDLKWATEFGRRALLDAFGRARAREMKIILARNTTATEQRIQFGGKGTSTLVGLDEQLVFATRDRCAYEVQIVANATVNLAPDPKDTDSVKPGHRVVCERLEPKEGEPEQFMLRMGGFGEEVIDGDVLVCDYTKPLYRGFLLREVGDVINVPGRGKCEILEILMPYDPVVMDEQQKAA